MGKLRQIKQERKRNPKIKNRAIAMAVRTEKARCLAVWLLLFLFFWFFYLYYVSFLLLVWACQPFRLDCRLVAFIFAFTLAAQSYQNQPGCCTVSLVVLVFSFVQSQLLLRSFFSRKPPGNPKWEPNVLLFPLRCADLWSSSWICCYLV